jgi:hypothetical protein
MLTESLRLNDRHLSYTITPQRSKRAINVNESIIELWLKMKVR